MSADVGQDIESLCNKCGDVWHVVVAKVGVKIVKVQCKQCGGYHRHRPPGGSTAAKTPRVRATGTRKPGTTQKVTPRISEPMVAADLQRPVRDYDFRAHDYQPGDRVEHPKFGLGVVELVNEPGKMQVFFSEGRRVLARAKPSLSLERPRPFEHGPVSEPEPSETE